MSNRTVLWSLVAAIVLAVLAALSFVLPRVGGIAPGAGTIAAGSRLLDLNPADITSISFTDSGASCTLQRSPEAATADQWTVQTRTGSTSTPSPAWVLSSDRMRSALRILSEAQAVATLDRNARLDSRPDPVTLLLRNGERIELRFAAKALAGGVVVEVTTDGKARLAVAPIALRDMLTLASVRAWRESRMLSGVGTSASRLRLVSAGGSIAMGKVRGYWSLYEPVSSPVDAGAVARALGVLEAVQAVRFFDDSPPESALASIENATTRVIVEVEGAVGGTQTRELRIGGPADASGKNLVASMDGGRSLVAIDASVLAPLSVDATRYISTFATRVLPPDIGGLEMKLSARSPTAGTPASLTFIRSLEGWNEVRSSGARPDEEAVTILQTPAQAEQIGDSIAFLSGSACNSIRIEPPEGFASVGSVFLKSMGGEPLDELTVGTASGLRVVLRTGQVYRGFAKLPPVFESFFGQDLPAPAQRSTPSSGRDGTPPDANK